jgi:hypothetical protein
LPVVGDVDDNLTLRIEFGDRVYNVYSFIKGGNTPLTLGALKGLSKYDTNIGYSYYVNLILIETSSIEGFVIDPATGTGGGGGSIDIDGTTITENASGQIQAVALKDGVIKVEDSLITKGNFNGVVELESRLQYNELKTNGTIVIDGQTITYDANTVYVIPSGNLEGRVAILEGTVTDLSQDVAMALKYQYQHFQQPNLSAWTTQNRKL